MITAETKKSVVSEHRTHATDTGSPQIQVAMLTTRIQELTDHLKTHPKDNHSRRGLLQMVGKRKKILKYLRDTDGEAYLELIAKLGLRR